MNCYKCATPLPDDARFCLSCGADVSGEHSAERTLLVEADPELLAKLQMELGGDYIIEKELGRGGMAIVFLGHDAHLGRKVAIKVLPPELVFSASAAIVERFKREARLAATLDHVNIIPVYRVSTAGKLFWYVMKYLEGESLDRVLVREGQLAVDRTVDIIRQVADALDYAHEKAVVHRDIKPGNIMLDAKGRVTVTDFGIAKALDAGTLTASGAMIGTPYYMSPEQCSGKRVGPASDQYSLAVMTFQMLGGHLPFTGDSVVDIIRKHVMDPVPPLGVLRPQLPEAVVHVVERGLAKQPEERFPSCAAFATGLSNASQGLDVTVAPPSKPSGVRLSETALVSPVPGALRTAKGTWRERKGLIAAVGGLVLVAGAATALLVGRAGRASLEQQGPGFGDLASRGVAGGAQSAAPVAAASESARAGAPTAPGASPATSPLARPTSRESQLASPTRTVAARPPGAAQPATATPLQPGPTQPAMQPQAQPASPPPAAPARPSFGWITVGTNPASTVYVNGVAAGRSPLRNYRVTPGRITLRFQVSDSTGLWEETRPVTVNAGDTVNLRIITLVRP